MVAVIQLAYILVTEGYENSFRVARNDTKRAKREKERNKRKEPFMKAAQFPQNETTFQPRCYNSLF
jgi:hypothetical protein